MLTSERIQLRDELIRQLENLHIIIKLKNGNYRRQIFDINSCLSIYPELQLQYLKYISEFRSEEEALYCMFHHDDFINYICPVCQNDYRVFYNMNNGYRKTCSNKECRKKLINTNEAKQKIIQHNQELYGVDWYVQTKEFQVKSIKTNQTKRGCDYPMQNPDIVALSKQTKQERYGDENYNNRKQAEQTCLEKYGETSIMHVKQFVDLLKQKYKERHEIRNTLLNQNALNVIKQVSISYNIDNLTLSDIYYNDEYLSMFIKYMYMQKGELLQTNEISYIFKRYQTTIEKKMKRLNLISYFLLKDSELELQFRNFLIDNGLTEKINFERRNHDILSVNQETGKHPEIDFYLKDYNLCFEIDDVDSHNIGCKDINYHYNKTVQCLQKYIRLIHLWEWELNESNWFKTSQWIFNLLNQSKIQLNIFNDDNYDIRKVNKETELDFLNTYSMIPYQESNICIGIYYNNELIEILSFKDNILVSLCVKFDYELIEGTKEVIQSYINHNHLSNIITYVDLSKFTGKSLENIGFKLIGYEEPIQISENPNDGKFKQIYNCGHNIYELKGE